MLFVLGFFVKNEKRNRDDSKAPRQAVFIAAGNASKRGSHNGDEEKQNKDIQNKELYKEINTVIKNEYIHKYRKIEINKESKTLTKERNKYIKHA